MKRVHKRRLKPKVKDLFLLAVRVAELNDEKVDSLSRESVLGSASTKMANNDRWHYFSVAPYLIVLFARSAMVSSRITP